MQTPRWQPSMLTSHIVTYINDNDSHQWYLVQRIWCIMTTEAFLELYKSKRRKVFLPYKIQILMWWWLRLILVLWLAAKTKQKNPSWIQCAPDVVSSQIFPAYIFEFEYVPSSLSFRWHLFLGGRSFIFGASESCRPSVDLLLGLKGNNRKRSNAN